MRYVWNNRLRVFEKLEGLDNGLTCAQVHDNYGEGRTVAEHNYKIELYGKNSIQVEVKSYFRLFIDEVRRKLESKLENLL